MNLYAARESADIRKSMVQKNLIQKKQLVSFYIPID